MAGPVFRDHPDGWPRAQQPSRTRIFWWRAVLLALRVLVPLYIRDSPTPRPEPAGLELGALLVRLWIAWYRAGTRTLGWTGLLFTWQLLLSASPSGWWTVGLLTIAALWLGASVETLRRERAHRLWLPRHGDRPGQPQGGT